VTSLAVIDLAGTLVRDDGAVEAAFVDALDAVGALGEDGPDATLVDVIRSTMGQSKITVFRGMLKDEDVAQNANRAFEIAYAERVARGDTQELPAASETLRALRANGVKIAVTTGFSAETRDLLLDTLAWTEVVDAALSPTEQIRGRPAPDLVLAAVIKLGIDDVHEVAVVGDTVNDLLSGYRAGAGVVAGVLSGAHDRAALESAPHTHILESVAEVPAVLAG